jgi:hypothetical protein
MWEEIRNVQSPDWKADEMTHLLTGQEGTREERAMAIKRRKFWDSLREDEK